mgnify:CR=1 FL=1
MQKTGWGKSFVYFIATKLLRDGGNGPALLISPLLALMRNQIAAAERMGVRAETINSDNVNEWSEVESKLARGEVDILLISPERLASERFRTQVLAGIAARISMLVIDEAHCISDWGHDFRPHYRLLERIVRTLPPNLRLLATTATANNRVMEDLAGVLGPNLEVFRGDLNRSRAGEAAADARAAAAADAAAESRGAFDRQLPLRGHRRRGLPVAPVDQGADRGVRCGEQRRWPAPIQAETSTATTAAIQSTAPLRSQISSQVIAVPIVSSVSSGP